MRNNGKDPAAPGAPAGDADSGVWQAPPRISEGMLSLVHVVENVRLVHKAAVVELRSLREELCASRVGLSPALRSLFAQFFRRQKGEMAQVYDEAAAGFETTGKVK